MSQIVLAATKRIDIKQFLNSIKRFLTEAVLTDTGMITILALIMTFTGLMLIQSTLTQSNEAKSVAWYAANIKDAQAKNNECRRDNNATQLQSTPDCVNALHAIEIRFK
ncbi:MAG: hypothetical protein RLZZ66_410 [Pseudomonadota bacterium]|jgi:HSP90 family molecular chaperone